MTLKVRAPAANKASLSKYALRPSATFTDVSAAVRRLRSSCSAALLRLSTSGLCGVVLTMNYNRLLTGLRKLTPTSCKVKLSSGNIRAEATPLCQSARLKTATKRRIKVSALEAKSTFFVTTIEQGFGSELLDETQNRRPSPKARPTIMDSRSKIILLIVIGLAALGMYLSYWQGWGRGYREGHTHGYSLGYKDGKFDGEHEVRR